LYAPVKISENASADSELLLPLIVWVGFQLPEGPETVQTQHAQGRPGCPVFPKADIARRGSYDRVAAIRNIKNQKKPFPNGHQGNP